jgi:hypothetical protein
MANKSTLNDANMQMNVFTKPLRFPGKIVLVRSQVYHRCHSGYLILLGLPTLSLVLMSLAVNCQNCHFIGSALQVSQVFTLAFSFIFSIQVVWVD